MEENQNTENKSETASNFQENNSSGVSFPTVGAPKKSNGAKTVLVIGILVLVGILGFVIFKSATKKNDTLAEPTPFDNLTEPQTEGTSTTEPTATPASTPKATDKSSVQIQIQNGTGITGEAAFLQTQLKSLGYTDIKAGNASTQDASATKVTFSKSLDQSIVDEITQKLNTLYQKVTVATSTTQTFDVVIVTGLRKGATPKPSASPSASPSATPTATP